MIEASRSTYTHLTMDKESLDMAIRSFLYSHNNILVPDDASIHIAPDGAIIEFTEHEGPHLPTPEVLRVAEMTEEEWYGVQVCVTRTPPTKDELHDELCDSLAPPPERLEKYTSPTADQKEWAVFPEKRAKEPDPCNKPWPPFPPADRKHLSQS